MTGVNIFIFKLLLKLKLKYLTCYFSLLTGYFSILSKVVMNNIYSVLIKNKSAMARLARLQFCKYTAWIKKLFVIVHATKLINLFYIIVSLLYAVIDNVAVNKTMNVLFGKNFCQKKCKIRISSFICDRYCKIAL